MCDFDDCPTPGGQPLVYLNPNLAPPPSTGQPFYLACDRHARAIVAPENERDT